MRRILAAAACVLGLGATASAQCVLEIESVFGGSGVSGTETRTVPIETRATFECGITSGTSCAVGTATGTCSLLTIETESLSCEGTCAIDAGGTLSCAGTEISRSQVTAECVSGVCQVTSDAEGDEPLTDLVGVTVNDPAGLENSVAKCTSGDLDGAHSYGIFAVTP